MRHFHSVISGLTERGHTVVLVSAHEKSRDKAIEVQTEYAKTAYEGFVAEATKLSGLYTDLAKETYKPFEGIFARAK
jgi:hypothetical protein